MDTTIRATFSIEEYDVLCELLANHMEKSNNDGDDCTIACMNNRMQKQLTLAKRRRDVGPSSFDPHTICQRCSEETAPERIHCFSCAKKVKKDMVSYEKYLCHKREHEMRIREHNKYRHKWEQECLRRSRECRRRDEECRRRDEELRRVVEHVQEVLVVDDPLTGATSTPKHTDMLLALDFEPITLTAALALYMQRGGQMTYCKRRMRKELCSMTFLQPQKIRKRWYLNKMALQEANWALIQTMPVCI